MSKNKGTSSWSRCPNSGLRKILHGMSIVAVDRWPSHVDHTRYPLLCTSRWATGRDATRRACPSASVADTCCLFFKTTFSDVLEPTFSNRKFADVPSDHNLVGFCAKHLSGYAHVNDWLDSKIHVWFFVIEQCPFTFSFTVELPRRSMVFNGWISSHLNDFAANLNDFSSKYGRRTLNSGFIIPSPLD